MTVENILFLAGVGFFGLCTLVFLAAAFRASAGWGMAGLLIPPSAVFFYAVFWTRRRTLALIHFTSLLMLLLVCVVWVRANPDWFDHSRLAPLRDWLTGLCTQTAENPVAAFRVRARHCPVPAEEPGRHQRTSAGRAGEVRAHHLPQ